MAKPAVDALKPEASVTENPGLPNQPQPPHLPPLTPPGAQPGQAFPAYPQAPAGPAPVGGPYYPPPFPTTPPKRGGGAAKALIIGAVAVLLLAAIGTAAVLVATRKGDDRPIRIAPTEALPTEAQVESATLQHLKPALSTPWSSPVRPDPVDPTSCTTTSSPFSDAIVGPAVAIAVNRFTDTGDPMKFSVVAQPGVAVFDTADAATAALTKLRAGLAQCTRYTKGDSEMTVARGPEADGKESWTLTNTRSWTCGRDFRVYRNVIAYTDFCRYGNTSSVTGVVDRMIDNVKAGKQGS
ncbi:sensor domain-containing protein [Gordonia sp. (in: high G+C Gram-positive bacteria)]|uniref:sensor domain-containing protein n=1 Tax=Gordonia sp. (in: high G+C Gram-positive bacteria) TaxID=84139 RepID=UPI0039E622AA